MPGARHLVVRGDRSAHVFERIEAFIERPFTKVAVKLDNALTKLEAGQVKVASNVLRAFINEVADLVETGVLLEADGQMLIDAASWIRDSLK